MAFETEKDLAPAEEPGTSRDEAGEPSGEEEPANEEQGLRDKEQAEQSEPEDYLALAQRIQADFENYRKRAAREAGAARGGAERGGGGEDGPRPRAAADRRQPRAGAGVRRGRRAASRRGCPARALG